MTSNYDLLKAKAVECVAKADALQQKQDLLSVAKDEATQAVNLHDSTSSDLAARKKILDDATADKESLNSRKSAIISAATNDVTTMTTLLNKRGKGDGSDGLYMDIDAKTTDIDTLLDDTACIAFASPLPPRVTGSAYEPTPPGNGVPTSIKHYDCLRSQYISILDAANTNLVVYRIEKEQQELDHANAVATLLSLKEAGVTGTPLDNQQAEVDNIGKFISNAGGGINEPPGALELVPDPVKRGLTEAIADELVIVGWASSKIADTETQISEKLTDYRTAQREKDDFVAELHTTLAALGTVINRLQDSVGFTTTMPVVAGANLDEVDLKNIHPGHFDHNENTADVAEIEDAEGITTRIGVPEGAYGSNLSLNIQEAAAAQNVMDAYTTGSPGIIAALTALEATRKTAVSTTAVAVKAAENAVDAAQTLEDACMDSLQVLIDNQRKIEVDAAAALLNDFLSKGSQVVTDASAPTVESAVESEIAKTCESSKVRALVSQIKASYTDETTYKTLRDQFCKDPVNSFFNIISDPCFVLLSQEQVNAYVNGIRSDFAARAKALCGKYGGSSSSVSLTPIIVIIAIILAVLVGMYFLRN